MVKFMKKEIMKLAILEAIKANKNDEVPVGAILVKNDVIISKGRNNRQKKKNVLGHAEINAIIKGAKKNKDWRLDGFELYCSLEPCPMCACFIKESRIKKIYYNLPRKNDRTIEYFKKNNIKIEQITINDGIFDEQNKMILQNFFQKRR